MSHPLWACPCSRCTPLRLYVALPGNRLRPAPGFMHLPGLSRSGSALRKPSEAQICLGLRFVPFPGPSGSGVGRARSLRLTTFPCCSLFWVYPGAPRHADGDCPEPPEVLVSKEAACSLVGKFSPGLRLSPFSPYGSGCLSPAGDGLQPAISVLPFVLCTVLAVSHVRAFRVVAIPQSGLLAQVSSLWLRTGHPCPNYKALQPMPPVPACPAPTC